MNSCAFNNAFFRPTESTKIISDTVRYENWKLRSNSGKRLNGRFYKLHNTAPRATVFMLQGESGDMDSWYELTAIMLKHGFQVISFDYQGFGISQGKANHKNILSDSQLILDSLRKRPEVIGTDIICWGFSIGANLAVKLAVDNPSAFDFLILEAPFPSQHAYAVKNAKFPASIFAYPFAASPYATKELIPRISRTPILIVHSIEDKIVPYEMGEKIYKLAPNPKLFFEVLGPHNFALLEYEKYYLEKIDKLLTLKTK